MSASWYTWLEQGRDIKVSDGILDAISSALRLDETERAHLYRLAGVNPPQAPGEPLMRDQDRDRLQLVVDGWLPSPALVVDRHWNTLAANAEARSLLGITSDSENFLAVFFLDPASTERYPEWADLAGRLVGQFRILAARYPEDPEFDEIAQRLSAANGEFARLWERHETCDTSVIDMHIRHPRGGSVRYEQVTLGLLERSDLRLMLYMPHGANHVAHD